MPRETTMNAVWLTWLRQQLKRRFAYERGWFTAGQVARELSISVVTAKKWLMWMRDHGELQHKMEQGANRVETHYFRQIKTGGDHEARAT